MSKLFSVFGKKTAQRSSAETPKRFTRFQDAPECGAWTPDADKKFTRFGPHETTVRPAPMRRQAQNNAAVSEKVMPATDHLTSEAQIPVSILRRALPKRFAEMQEERQMQTSH